MKRLLPVMLACLLLFTSCGAKQAVKNPFKGKSGNFITAAAIRYKGLEAIATISQVEPSSCSFVFEAPRPVAGMSFVFSQDDVDVHYKGMNLIFARDFMPYGAVANVTVQALGKVINDEELTVNAESDTPEIRGMAQTGEFILKIDRDTGEIAKLSVPAQELEIEFHNFRFLD